MQREKPVRSIDVRDVYHQEYFLRRVDGHDRFDAFDGTPATLFARARRNFELLDIQAGERFLDLGCGRGEVAIAAGVAGATAIGCDFSVDAVVLAQLKARSIEKTLGRGINVTFLCAVATDGPFRPNTFDKVLMSEFVEHVAPQEITAILRNVWQWLRPGGRVLIYTYPNRWARRTYPLMRMYVRVKQGVDIGERPDDTLHPDYHKLHLNEQSYVSIHLALRRAGFRHVRVWFDGHEPAGRSGALKRTLPYQLLFGANLAAEAVK